MASIHLMFFDLSLSNKDAFLLRECVLDSRLYYISGFEYWIEQGLIEVWPHLTEQDRGKAFDVLRDLLTFEETASDVPHYLARLPAAELPDDFRDKRPSAEDAAYRPKERPQRASFDLQSEWKTEESDDRDVEIGPWPPDFDRELLKEFARSTTFLSEKNATVESLRENVPRAFGMAKGLLPTLRLHIKLLEDSSRFWIWKGLLQILSSFRRSSEASTEEPDHGVVLGCAELALLALEDVPTELPGSLPEGDLWTGYRETGWGNALHLADEALTWPPAADDGNVQSRFLAVIRAAFATEHPLVQLVCSISIRPFHWFRTAERLQMHDELVWSRQKYVSVLDWSLPRLQNSADVDRARVFRLLLNRSDLAAQTHFANRLGTFVGIGSMTMFVNGQRSDAAQVARDAIDSPQSFPFLQDVTNRGEFLSGVVFGMKEQAKLVASSHPQLAADYGDWVLKVWRIMRAQRKKRNESEGIVLFAIHWLEKNEGKEIELR